MAVDRRGKLQERPFSARASEGKVFVSYDGRVVRTLTGRDAASVERAMGAGDEDALQLLLARLTGNFKRGNERQG